MKNSAFIRLAGEEDTAYVDIFTTYGVSFIKGSYLELIKKSSKKDYVSNNSYLEHGTRYIATPEVSKYAERKISLKILLEASSMTDFVSKIERFTDKISSGMFFLKIPSRDRVFKLVYSDLKVLEEYRGNKATFTLEIIEPNPNDRIVLSSSSS